MIRAAQPLALCSALPYVQAKVSLSDKPKTAAKAIAAQTDPNKLATLKGERAVNPCLQRCVRWLAVAKARGETPEGVLAEAAKNNGRTGTPYAIFIGGGLLENLKNAKDLRLLTQKTWPN